MPERSAGGSEIRVMSGELVAQRLVDVAYAIDLAKVEKLWSQHVGAASTRSRLSTAPPKAVAFDVPPVLLQLGAVQLVLDTGTVTAQVTARLYDFGVLALSLRVPVVDVAWMDYVRALNALDRAVGTEADTTLWDEQRGRVISVILNALDRPSGTLLNEDYLLGVVYELAEPLGGMQLLERADWSWMLTGEQRPLSEPARRDLVKHAYSYFDDDLVVLAWDRAFVYEVQRESDVADVLEVANAQLLELRYYDELLDAELPRMNDRVEAAHRATSLLAARRFAHLARRLYTLVADVTELTEKVDNALQVTEDVYLARVYSAALELFRVRAVGAAVDRKLAIIRETYTALYDEAHSQRAELLEIAIIVLIVVEIAIGLWRH